MSALLELEARRHEVGGLLDEGVALVLHELIRDGLAVEFCKRRLVVEEVELTGRADLEHVDDAFRFRGEVRSSGRKGIRKQRSFGGRLRRRGDCLSERAAGPREQ